MTTGHVYTATVKAVNEIGVSGHSSPPLTLYTGYVPSKITYLVWEDSTTTSVEFRWKLPESNGGLSLTKFKCYIDVGQTGSFDTEEEILDIYTRTFKVSSLQTSELVDI